MACRFACMGGKRVTVETAAAHKFARTGDARILARSAGAMLARSGCEVVESESTVGSLRTQMAHKTARYLAAVSVAWMKLVMAEEPTKEQREFAPLVQLGMAPNPSPSQHPHE